jgi:hypothetical protein
MLNIKSNISKSLFLISIFVASLAACAGKESNNKNDEENIVNASIKLTVSESKRLIAKGVVELPMIKKAMKKGMVVICKGTTNTYIAEELLGKDIKPGALVYGKVYPEKGGEKLPAAEPLPEVVFVDGKYKPELSLSAALKKLKPGDVVIKGANALDYENETAGVFIGAPDAGTSGKIMPYIIARKANLLIPVGLEKQVSCNVADLQLKLRQPHESINFVPSMFLLTGHIFTEIEAIKALTEVEVFQAGSGGIGGAQGAVWLVARGPRAKVEKALKIASQVHGEPPFTAEIKTESTSK